MNEGKERFHGLRIGYWVSERLQEKKWFKEMLSGFFKLFHKKKSFLNFYFSIVVVFRQFLIYVSTMLFYPWSLSYARVLATYSSVFIEGH